MIYSKLYFKKKYNKSLTLFLVFIFSIFFFSYIFYRSSSFSRASKKIVNRIEITNISPIQATIFWQTSKKSFCFIVYGDDRKNLNKFAYDERNSDKYKNNYFNHYAILKNLKLDKNYYFFIICDNNKITRPDGEFFTFKTPKFSHSLKKPNTINGKILRENLSPLSDAVVLLSIQNKKIYPLSYLVKTSGEWIINLSSLYNQNDFSEFLVNENQEILIEIFSEDNKKTNIIGNLKKLSEKTHTFIIGKDFNLINEENVLSSSENNVNQKDRKNFFEIVYPKEGAIIPGNKPLIKGIGIPNSSLFLEIFKDNQKKYSFYLTVNKNGLWSYSISDDLSLGNYKMILTGKNNLGKEIKTIRNFKITGRDAFEGKVLGMASEEPNIKPTYNVNQTPSPTIFISPTLINDYSLNLSPSPSLPISGNFALISFIGSLILILLGISILIIF